jgi:hypothetical protein
LVTGGNRVHYPGIAVTLTTNLLTVKLLINGIIGFQHPPSQKSLGSTISTYKAHIWGKEAIFTKRRRFPCPQKDWKEIHPGGM